MNGSSKFPRDRKIQKGYPAPSIERLFTKSMCPFRDAVTTRCTVVDVSLGEHGSKNVN